MTVDETIRILAMIEANWQPVKNQQAAIDLWASCFRDDQYILVEAAVLTLIQTSDKEFRPTVGMVRRKMHDIVYGRRITETEAWLLVKNSLPEAQEGPETLKGARSAWDKLPDDVKKLVTPKQLLEYNSIPAEQMDTVIQSNFMRSFRELQNIRTEKETVSMHVLDVTKRLQSKSAVYTDLDAVQKPQQPALPKAETPDPWMHMTDELRQKHAARLDAFLVPVTKEEIETFEKREYQRAEQYLK